MISELHLQIAPPPIPKHHLKIPPLLCFKVALHGLPKIDATQFLLSMHDYYLRLSLLPNYPHDPLLVSLHFLHLLLLKQPQLLVAKLNLLVMMLHGILKHPTPNHHLVGHLLVDQGRS